MSKKLLACRKRVHDDAFEAQITVHMVSPLLDGVLNDLQLDYQRTSATFLRRALARYLTLALYRLLDRANNNGRTGTTASIAALLDMARSEGILSDTEVNKFESEIKRIKNEGANGEYDLIRAIRDLRNIQVAHSLIPKDDPTDQLWAHHLVEFAAEIFEFVIDLEAKLVEATGTSLEDLRENAKEFEKGASKFWHALASEQA